MKINSKLSRKQLALRLFAAALVINIVLLMLFVPSPPDEIVEVPLPADMVELKVKATLFTSFLERKEILLVSEGQPVGPVILLKQEDDESLTIALKQELYRQHHQRLAQDTWSALPYLDGLLKTKLPGVNYEIAY